VAGPLTWVVAGALAPLALALVVRSLREPMRVALPVYAALVPFGGAISIGPSRYGSASSLMGLVLALGLVGQLISGRRTASRIAPTVPVWILFLGLAFATGLWTVDRGVTISGLAVLTSLVVVYVLGALSYVDRTVVRRVENGILVGGSAAVGYGFYQLVFLGGFLNDTSGEADSDRFGNGLLGPNIEAATLLVPMAIALHRACAEAGRTHRLVSAATAALMLTGIFMTGSRTGTLGAGVVLLALLFTAPRRARRGLIVALVAGVVVAAAVWVYQPLGLTERTFESATSSSGRLDIWTVGLAACQDHCALGAGWGTFPDVYAQTQSSVPGAKVLTGEGGYQPHNIWLLALIEVGFLGTLLFTLGLVISLKEAVRLPDEFRPPAVAALLGLIFALIFLSSMEFKIFWMVLLLVTLYGNVVHAERSRGSAVGADPDQREGVPATGD
jgi:O-antigen ligase